MQNLFAACFFSLFYFYFTGRFARGVKVLFAAKNGATAPA